MNLLQESIRYLGMGYWNLPDEALAYREPLDRANLYYRWGKEGGSKGDFLQALRDLGSIADESLAEEALVLDKYRRLLDIVLEVLRLETREAAYWFNFLCEHRMRIELRETAFPEEVKRKVGAFVDQEEDLHRKMDGIKASFAQYAGFSDRLKQERKAALEQFEAEREKVDQGIEAFYARIKEYISR